MSDIIDDGPKRVPMGPLEHMPASSERKCRYCKQELGFKRNSEGLLDFVTADECPYCRDRFSRAAITGLLANRSTASGNSAMQEEIADRSYLLADAMMKARLK